MNNNNENNRNNSNNKCNDKNDIIIGGHDDFNDHNETLTILLIRISII